MLSRAALLAVVITFAASGSAGAVQFGGGYVPHPDSRERDAAVTLAFRTSGQFRFATALRCGGRGLIEVEKSASGRVRNGVFFVAGGGRLPYSGRASLKYDIRVDIVGDTGTGTIRVSAEWTLDGRKVTCTPYERPVKVHAAGDGRGAPTPPAASAAFYGVGGFEKPTLSPVVLAVDGTGARAHAFWGYTSPCTRGHAERRTDYSPRGRIVGNRYLSRERFTVRYQDGVVGYYRATLDVRFHGATATGTFRMRVRFAHRGRTTVRCDSKTQPFNAWAM